MTKLRVSLALLGIVLLFVLFPRLFGAEAYTLYCNSGTDMTKTGFSTMRIHIATFEANETGAYNQENCDLASKLFKQQYGVTKVDYW